MASEPKDDYMFNVQQFDELTGLVETIFGGGEECGTFIILFGIIILWHNSFKMNQMYHSMDCHVTPRKLCAISLYICTGKEIKLFT